MPSPSQNGIVSRLSFQDGEGLTYDDLNLLSTNSRVFSTDIVLGGIMRVKQNTIGPAPIDANGTLFCYGHGGAPRNRAGTHKLGCNAGALFYCASASLPNGSTPRVIPYWLTADEISATLANGDASNPRFDAVYVRITEVDGP